MGVYVMFGTYSQESIKKISAERTEKAKGSIERYDGRLISAYALLGEKDLLLLVEFNNVEQAMKCSIALTKALDIKFSTSPAVPVEEFDRIGEKV